MKLESGTNDRKVSRCLGDFEFVCLADKLDTKLITTDKSILGNFPDLAETPEDHLAGETIRVPLTNPIGCNVKWDGKEAHWMPAEACDLV